MCLHFPTLQIRIYTLQFTLHKLVYFNFSYHLAFPIYTKKLLYVFNIYGFFVWDKKQKKRDKATCVFFLTFCKSLIILQVLSLLYTRAHGFDKFNNNVYFHVVLLMSTRIPAYYGQRVPSS